MARKARNVTPENFTEMAQAFITVHDGGFMIALREWTSHGVKGKPTPREWGAWRAYKIAKKIPVAYMDRCGQQNRSLLVPAAWPHLFDENWTIERDTENADRFLKGYRAENNNRAVAADKLAQVAAARAAFPKDRKWRDPLQPDLARDIPPAIDLSDFPDRVQSGGSQ